MGRWRSRSVKPLSHKKALLISLIVLLFINFQMFLYVEKNIKPHLMNVATMRIKQMATEAINSAITNRIATTVNFNNMVEWMRDDKGSISGLSLNYAQHLKIASETVQHVEELLHHLSEKPEKVPLGRALGSTLLASMGPDIPVRFVPLGHAKVDLKTRERDAGINMLLVEVYLHIMAEVAIIIPFDTQPEIVMTEIPISYLLVVGDVPMYYFDYKGNMTGVGPSPSVPGVALPSIPLMGSGIYEEINATNNPEAH
jgi:sporulation protein YunB